jgi:hypothetical protein
MSDFPEPTSGAPVDFPFAEKNVRQKIGLPKDDLRALRRAHLTAADFTIHKKALYLTRGAVEKLFTAAAQLPAKSRCARSEDDPGAVKTAPAKKTAEVETLLVVRTDLKNPHLLLACPKGDDPDRPEKPLRVRVRSTVNFIRRMEIPAILVDGYTDLYDLARSAPRKKGKW